MLCWPGYVMRVYDGASHYYRHAFDGQSLNGLASKIMRGTYAPINSKYSQGLRDLISCMLKKEPGERPTLAQVPEAS